MIIDKHVEIIIPFMESWLYDNIDWSFCQSRNSWLLYSSWYDKEDTHSTQVLSTLFYANSTKDKSENHDAPDDNPNLD